MVKHSLVISQKHHFTEFALQALKVLKYFSSFSGSSSKYSHYSLMINQTFDILKTELESDDINQRIIIQFSISAASKHEHQELIKESYSRTISLNAIHDTYSTRMNMYRVGIHYFDSINDYKSLIDLADDCESYLYSNPHLLQNVRLGEMNLNKLYGSLHLRNLDAGKIYAERCKKLFNYGSLNWLIFSEYYFLLCLHTDNQKMAAEIFNHVIQHPGFKNYPERSREKWRIFEAFLNYYQSSTKENSRHFNTNRFVNEVPIFTKDKAGYNLSIIIAQVILLIKKGDFEKVIDKADSLKLYASRYIRKEKSPRSYYFLKMLLVMIKYDFDAAKTEQIASKFYDKLKSTQLGEQHELETLEVIPYDLLWPKLLRQINTKAS
jgi:hypothetical protein